MSVKLDWGWGGTQAHPDFEDGGDTAAEVRRLREVLASMPGMVYQVGLDERLLPKYYHINDGGKAVFGRTADSMDDDAVRMVNGVNREDRAKVTNAFMQAARTGEPAKLTYRYTAPDGTQRWTRTHVVPVKEPGGRFHWNGFSYDVTREVSLQEELQQARDAAQVAERRVREICDRVPGVVTEYRTEPDGKMRFTFVSGGIREMVGLEPQELLDDVSVLMGSLYPEDAPKVMASMANDALGFMTMDYRLVHRDGRVRWCRDFTHKHLAPDGARITSTCLQDISESIELQDQLARTRDAAEAASRAKTEFLANMSHEIRTPMNAILSFAYLGLRTLEPGKQRQFFAEIESAAQSLLSIVNDVLDLSKVEAGKLELLIEPFTLAQALDHLESVVGLRAREKGLGFRIDIENDVPAFLVGDALRLGQILMNLGGNAVKFTEAGEVVLKARVVERYGDRARLEFSVRDTGIGLSPEQCNKLFQPFAQADSSTTRRYGGTGLGLSICKRLVELMDGQIGVDSAPGQGSTFRFSVPLGVADKAPAAYARSSSANEQSLRGLSVLVVDDHEANLEVARQLLESVGVRVTLAASGEAAIAAAAAHCFDAVFMDMRMPGMDGVEATRRIRAAESGRTRVPIIALTANVMAPDRERCLSAGMDDFVGKPIEVERLFAALARACDRPVVAGSVDATIPPVEAAVDHDYERARAQLARAPELYDVIVRRYAQSPELIARLRTQVGQGQKMEAAITAHTLKGSSAQVGALRVARIAAQLEQVLEQRLATGAEIDELDATLREALARLAQLVPVKPDDHGDATRVRTLRAQLEQELEDDEDSAWDTFERWLAAMPPVQRADYAKLGALIASLDYDDALRVLRAG